MQLTWNQSSFAAYATYQCGLENWCWLNSLPLCPVIPVPGSIGDVTVIDGESGVETYTCMYTATG